MSDCPFDSIPNIALDNLTEQMKALLQADYSIPDPAWDYADLWQHIMHLQRDIGALAQLLSQQDQASPEADQLIRKYLDQICDSAIAASQRPLGSRSSDPHRLDTSDRGHYHLHN